MSVSQVQPQSKVNRETFQKTEKEKQAVKAAKKAHKKLLKK